MGGNGEPVLQELNMTIKDEKSLLAHLSGSPGHELGDLVLLLVDLEKNGWASAVPF